MHSLPLAQEPLPPQSLPLESNEGYMHSFEVGSALDGPGLRFMLWTTGCHLRCQYCHNPDTWKLKSGRRITLPELMAQIRPYRRMLQRARGGVTVSGGEPLVQAPFVSRVFEESQQLGLHTALETNGYFGHRLSDRDLSAIDLVLLDVKAWSLDRHLHVTGRSNEPVLRFARRLSELRRPMWIRYVLVPGLTDLPEEIRGVAQLAASLSSVERVEVLPFQQLGRYKWDELGLPYPLRKTEPPSVEQVQRAVDQFRALGLNAR